MYTSKHKRNLAITGGVAASIIVAPVVAGLTVGKTRCTVNTEGHTPDVVYECQYIYGSVTFQYLCRKYI